MKIKTLQKCLFLLSALFLLFPTLPTNLCEPQVIVYINLPLSFSLFSKVCGWVRASVSVCVCVCLTSFSILTKILNGWLINEKRLNRCVQKNDECGRKSESSDARNNSLERKRKDSISVTSDRERKKKLNYISDSGPLFLWYRRFSFVNGFSGLLDPLKKI